MGRYYNGDIEGKFWFGVQSSNDADFFGVDGYQPERLEYEFQTENLPEVEKGIAKCKKELGEYKKKMDDFFKEVNGYNDDIVKEHGFNVYEFNDKLEWYARLKLGENIYKYLKKNGSCYFEAEC